MGGGIFLAKFMLGATERQDNCAFKRLWRGIKAVFHRSTVLVATRPSGYGKKKSERTAGLRPGQGTDVEGIEVGVPGAVSLLHVPVWKKAFCRGGKKREINS